jgi:monoterpene epsilon-lactone hydrolase
MTRQRTLIRSLIVVLCAGLIAGEAENMAKADEPRTMTRRIPVPADVSAEAQAVLGGPLNPIARHVPKTTEDWQKIIREIDEEVVTTIIEPTGKHYPVAIEKDVIAGVNVFIVRPKGPIPEARRDVRLINLHGGGYIVNGGANAVLEAIPVAHLFRAEVIAVDYRMPPEYPFPAALDDAVAVYRAVVAQSDPDTVGVYGTSAGGGLTAALMLKANAMDLPLPAAVGLIAPWSDLSETGDTYHTNEEIDPTLVTYDGILGAAARLYAGDHDLKDPLISPVYGDFSKGFPPALIVSGTRDLLLSCAVRLHRRLVAAGVETELHVFEALWHDFVVTPGLPEAREGWDLLVRFFDRRLGQGRSVPVDP